MRSALADGDQVVKVDEVSGWLLAAEMTDAAVAFDDVVAVYLLHALGAALPSFSSAVPVAIFLGVLRKIPLVFLSPQAGVFFPPSASSLDDGFLASNIGVVLLAVLRAQLLRVFLTIRTTQFGVARLAIREDTVVSLLVRVKLRDRLVGLTSKASLQPALANAGLAATECSRLRLRRGVEPYWRYISRAMQAASTQSSLVPCWAAGLVPVWCRTKVRIS